MKITRELATKVRDVVDAGLVKGLGEPTPGKMCVEAAVCYAMGLPHSDEPSCVSSAIRSAKIVLNDSLWSSNQTRAKGMRRLAIAQLGSAGVIDDREFSRRLTILCVKTVVANALKTAAALQTAKHKKELENHASICENVKDLAASEAASWAASEAARDRVLADFAENVVQLLVELGSPGCEFLDVVSLD